jgi:hypothetical protein
MVCIGHYQRKPLYTLLIPPRANTRDYHINNRESPYMFRDGMLKLLAETLPYAKLIAE